MARSRHTRTSWRRRSRLNLRSWLGLKITKTFLCAKTFRARNTNYLRQEKGIRDHVDELGGPM
jgi:hypothetical protein